MNKYLEEQRKLAGITPSERGAFSSTGCMEVARPLPSTVLHERQDDDWIMKLPRELPRLYESKESDTRVWRKKHGDKYEVDGDEYEVQMAKHLGGNRWQLSLYAPWDQRSETRVVRV